MTDEKELKIGEVFPINEKLAGIVPMAIPVEQEALTANIKENGLREPVVLWKGEIVDGRCRQKSCTLAYIAVRARHLDDDLTEEEVVQWVKGANTRRNLTMAQKIMVASKESSREDSKPLDYIAKSWAIGRRSLTMANYISKARPEFIEPLLNGLTVSIIDAKNRHAQTNKITAIYNHIKREKDITPTETHTWTAEMHIDTQAGKDFFFEFISETNTTDVRVFEPIAYWINERFKAEESDI